MVWPSLQLGLWNEATLTFLGQRGTELKIVGEYNCEILREHYLSQHSLIFFALYVR